MYHHKVHKKRQTRQYNGYLNFFNSLLSYFNKTRQKQYKFHEHFEFENQLKATIVLNCLQLSAMSFMMLEAIFSIDEPEVLTILTI